MCAWGSGVSCGCPPTHSNGQYGAWVGGAGDVRSGAEALRG